MIDIDKAQKQITDAVTCEIQDKAITNAGTYLVFENIKVNNHLNIDYLFTLSVAIATFQKNRNFMYEVLNTALNEINSSDNIGLISCKFIKADGNLLIYELRLETNIIGN